MNAFARSNLAVALLRLEEARAKAEVFELERPRSAGYERPAAMHWSIREAIRLVQDALSLDEMESVDTLPMPPESGERRMG